MERHNKHLIHCHAAYSDFLEIFKLTHRQRAVSLARATFIPRSCVETASYATRRHEINYYAFPFKSRL